MLSTPLVHLGLISLLLCAALPCSNLISVFCASPNLHQQMSLWILANEIPLVMLLTLLKCLLKCSLFYCYSLTRVSCTAIQLQSSLKQHLSGWLTQPVHIADMVLRSLVTQDWVQYKSKHMTYSYKCCDLTRMGIWIVCQTFLGVTHWDSRHLVHVLGKTQNTYLNKWSFASSFQVPVQICIHL